MTAPNGTCSRRGCDRPSMTRGMCEPDYRRSLRMGLHGYRDVAAARTRVLALRDLGWTYEQISEAAGISTWVPHKIAIGQTRRLWPETERALLSLPLAHHDSQRGIPSTGTRRRIQALAWLGWPCSEVAARAGLNPRSLQTLIMPNRRVTYTIARKVADVYEQLSGTYGPSKIAAGKARQLGFAPPAAWDDDQIDNPRARPRGIRTEAAA